MDISSIITNVKKDFTRERASAITDFLKNNNNSVVISYIKKSRGDSIKIYYMAGDIKKSCDYIVKNAKIILNTFIKNGIKIYVYSKGDIIDYTEYIKQYGGDIKQ